jgi:NADPH2:quinone reductase
MKAIRVHRFGGPEELKLEEVPDPKPGAGELVLRIKAAGVNPVDTYIRSGTYARKPQLPYTPGSDGGGEVAAVGDGVTQFRPGDRVYLAGSLSGTYAEMALCHLAQVHPLPAKASYAEGAALGVPYATAYRAIFQRGRAVAGDVLFVHGASGGVGMACCQFGRAAGMTVIGSAGTDQGRKLARDAGAHHVLDHNSPDYMKRIPELTNGHGADVIIEMLANKNLAADLGVLALHGRVVVVGNRGTVEINPRDIMSHDGDVVGFTLLNISPADLASAHAAIVAGLETGILRPVIGKQFPLSEAARAHEEVMKPSGAYGKIVLVL